jgi:general secretion pathway protein A
LSNLETETQKLLQIVLIGQPELAQHLQLPELRQLNQRITARYHLKPLNLEETLQYIAYRLRVAGGRKKVHFARGAVRAVYRHSGGTPRVINAICDRALLIGYTKETRDLTASIVRRAAREIRGELMRRKGTVRAALKRLLPNPTVVVTAIVVLGLATYFLPVRYPNLLETSPPSEAPAPSFAPPDTAAPGDLPKAIATVQQNNPDIPLTPESFMKQLLHGSLAKTAPEPVHAGEMHALDPAAAQHAAVGGMLRAWNLALVSGFPEDDSKEALAVLARTNGLAPEILAPSLEELLAIGLPALTWMNAGGPGFWIALLGVEGDALRVTGEGSETVLVTKESFRRCYSNQAVVFWRDPTPEARLMKNGVAGPDIERLQQRLHALARFPEQPTGTYDEKTGRAVAKLQAETGIAIDGIAGKQVRMVLSSWAPDNSFPSLLPKRAGTVTPSLEAKKTTGDMPPALAQPSEAPKTANKNTEQPVPAPVAGEPSGPEVPAPPASGQQPPTQPGGSDNPTTSPPAGPAEKTGAVSEPTQREPGKVTVEELTPPPRDDNLAPPKTEPPKEVTAPVIGSSPLVPREPGKAAEDGKQS